MAGFLWVLVGIAAGACIAVQAPINAQFGRGRGIPVPSAITSLLAGTIGAVLLGAGVLITGVF